MVLMRDTVLTLDPSVMQRDSLILAFTLAKRAEATLNRRTALIRKSVDALLAKSPVEPGVAELRLSAILGAHEVTVVRENKSWAAQEIKEDLVKALCAKRGISFLEELTVQDPPPPPPPRRFSPDAFKLFASLGKISHEDYSSCIGPAEPTLAVSVDVSADIDAAVGQVLFR
jgi:hypothetical protein